MDSWLHSGTPPPSGIRPPADLFWNFLGKPSLLTDPKIFLKAPLTPIYTNYEGERAPKNAIFCENFPKKCPKTAFLTCFFKICLRRINYGQISVLLVLQESSEIQFYRSKGRQNFRIFFQKSVPSRKSQIRPWLHSNLNFKKPLILTRIEILYRV